MSKLIFLSLTLVSSSAIFGGNILLERLFPDEEESKPEKTYEGDVREDNCESGCAAYDEGYTWAEYNMPEKEDDCAQGNYNFDRGCYDWFDDNR